LNPLKASVITVPIDVLAFVWGVVRKHGHESMQDEVVQCESMQRVDESLSLAEAKEEPVAKTSIGVAE